MKKPTHIMGQTAPAPRVTKAAATLFAMALSLPVFLALTLLQALLG